MHGLVLRDWGEGAKMEEAWLKAPPPSNCKPIASTAVLPTRYASNFHTVEWREYLAKRVAN
jgi:hypothetical protein